MARRVASGEATSTAVPSSTSRTMASPAASPKLTGSASPQLPGAATVASSPRDPAEVPEMKAVLPGAAREEGEAAEDPSELTEEEQKTVRELESRDREVRTHEQTHKSVGGQYAGAINYEFQRGPDGQNYAVGGHVNIDVSPIPDDPAATVAKMQQVMRAALAPAEPSGADRSVAAKASGRAAEARREMADESSPAAEEGGSTAARPSEAPGAPSASAPLEPTAARDADLGAAVTAALMASQPRMVA